MGIIYERLSADFSELHRRQLIWMSKNPDQDRWDWPEWSRQGGWLHDVHNHMFPCEASIQKNAVNSVRHISCKSCPLDWHTKDAAYCTKKELRKIFCLGWPDDSVYHVWAVKNHPNIVKYSHGMRCVGGNKYENMMRQVK